MPAQIARHTPLHTLAVLVAAVLWGTTGTAQALGGAALHPVLVGWSRLLVGSVALALLAGIASSRTRTSDAPAPSDARRARWLLLAAASTATYQATFFAGVTRTGVALGTMVAIGLSPVLTGILGRLLLREPLSRGWGAATALATVGCALILWPDGGPGAADPAGVALSATAGGAYAMFAVAMRRVLRSDSPFLAPTAGALGIGAVLLAPLGLAIALGGDAGMSALGEPRSLVALLWLGVGATAGAYAFFGWGLRGVSAATAGSLTLAEPLVAFTLGVALLGERPPGMALAGSVLLLVGLGFLASPSRGPIPAAAG